MEQSNSSTNLFDLQIDPQSSSYLSETAKWAKFLSIVGFVFCGIFLLYGAFAGTMMSYFVSSFGRETDASVNALAGVGGVFIFIFVLIAVIIYFFPCLYLYRFSTKMRIALKNNDQSLLTGSLGNLKSVYKYIGILTIVGLSFFLLEIIFVLLLAVLRR